MTAFRHPVRLTQPQRKILVEILPEMADRFEPNEKNARRIPLTAEELEAVQRKAKAAMQYAENGTKQNSLRKIIDATSKAMEKSSGIGAIPRAERLYQFKITLFDSKPPIWRRIQVRNCTLDKLHEHIQKAMGWTNSHLDVSGELADGVQE